MKRTLLPLLAAFVLALPGLAADSFETDRKAILSMAGEFAVNFSFHETLSLQPGYQIDRSNTRDAHELVVVAEDTGRRIRLPAPAGGGRAYDQALGPDLDL